MAFEFSARHINEFHTQGYTVFRDLIPAPLLGDLRREGDRGRPMARALHGGNAQRLQPFQDHIDRRPFDALWQLPTLHAALFELFGGLPGCMDDVEVDGDAILYEPGDSPYCMSWHRDYRDLWPGLDLEKWQQLMHDPRMFNQSNVALYDDGALWVVPGSHLRRDTPDEIRRFPDRPIRSPDTSRMTPEEAEYAGRAYCQSMPGAVQAWLNAGDFMIYRNTLWHIGNYVPYMKRATVHGSLVTPEYRDFIINDFMPFVRPARPESEFRNLNVGTQAYREAYPGIVARRVMRKLKRVPGGIARRLKLGLKLAAGRG
jgi:hypothetical protein